MEMPKNDSYEVKIRPLNDHGAWGAIYFDERVIYLDPFQPNDSERIDSCVHEFMHAVYPELGEREIGWLTDAVYLDMTEEEEQACLEYYRQTPVQKLGNIAIWLSIWAKSLKVS